MVDDPDASDPSEQPRARTRAQPRNSRANSQKSLSTTPSTLQPESDRPLTSAQPLKGVSAREPVPGRSAEPTASQAVDAAVARALDGAAGPPRRAVDLADRREATALALTTTASQGARNPAVEELVLRQLRERDRRIFRLALRIFVVVAVLSGLLFAAVDARSENEAANAKRIVQSYSAAQPATPVSDAPAVSAASGPVVSILGDDLVAPSVGESRDRTDDSSTGAAVVFAGEPGAGYTTSPVGRSTLLEQARRVPRASEVVIFVAGSKDASAASLPLLRAATQSYAAARSAAPGARLIVVGPPWPGADPPIDILGVRNSLRAGAAIAGAEWVDPIDRKWLDVRAGTRDGDRLTLNPAGKRAFEGRLAGLVQSAVG